MTVRGEAGGEEIVEPARRIPVARRADVVVVGGGPAGVCAAVAAARAGASTVLLERTSFLGGTATGAMMASFMGFYWRDVRVSGGIAYEITRRLVDAGGADDFLRYVLGEATDNPFDVRTFPFDPEVLKVVLDDLTAEAGVDVRLHSQAAAPVGADGTVTGVAVEGRSERRAITAPVVIDAGADGTIARKAGAMVENATQDRSELQPMTLMARLTGVDVPRFRALPREEKQRLSKKGMERGELASRLLSLVSSPGGAGDAFILMTRVRGYDGADETGLSRAEREGRKQVMSVVAFLRREVPGFESCQLVALAPWIGIRETWRIVGDYVLTAEDVMSARQFDDAIAQGGGPLDVHHSQGGGVTLMEPPAPFSTPYRCLLPRGVEGLLVTGRCASATADAMGALRHMGSAMVIGQAAGVAAALAAADGVGPRQVDIQELRRVLREQDAIIESPVLTAS